MPRRRATPLLALVAAAAPVPALAQAPFAFADVDFTPDCRPNAAFERLLTVLVGSQQDAATADTPLHDAVAGDTFHRLILDRPADWHGLRLKGIDVYRGIERGPANYALIFDNPPSRVREVWNARGWELPPAGERREIAGLEGYAAVMLDGAEGEGAGAAVRCLRD